MQSKEEHAEYMRKWRAKRMKKADNGDEEAKKSISRDNKGSQYRAVKSYISTKANKRELSEFRDLIAERIKELNKRDKS